MKYVYLILIVTVFNSEVTGQWYTKKYGVNDINQLTQTQLEDSFVQAKRLSNTGDVFVVIGGICLPVASIYLSRSLNPEPGFLAGLDDGVRAAGFFIASVVLIIPGAVLITRGNSRRRLIEPVLYRYYEDKPTLSISPALMINELTKFYSTGISVTLKF